MDERRRDTTILVLHHEASTAQVVSVYQRPEWQASLVGRARLDIGRVHLEDLIGHARERWRAPTVHASLQPGSPREHDQISIVGVVIGVMVGDEDVSYGA